MLCLHLHPLVLGNNHASLIRPNSHTLNLHSHDACQPRLRSLSYFMIFSLYQINKPTVLARLVRVTLAAIICDKPAAYKMGSFASYSHYTFCTRHKIQKEDLQKPGYSCALLYLLWAHRIQPSPDAQYANKNTGGFAIYAEIHPYTARDSIYTALSPCLFLCCPPCNYGPMHNLKVGTCFLPP